MTDEVTYPQSNQEIMSVRLTTIPGTNPKTSGTRYEENGMCKTRRVERHTCYDTFYDMYEFLCECLEAVLLNPFGYHDIYEEVAWTSSWDQDEGSRAANQSHFFTYHHRIHHHQECFGDCQAQCLQALKEVLRHISSLQYDPQALPARSGNPVL